jgi:hypothetical protein
MRADYHQLSTLVSVVRPSPSAAVEPSRRWRDIWRKGAAPTDRSTDLLPEHPNYRPRRRVACHEGTDDSRTPMIDLNSDDF